MERIMGASPFVGGLLGSSTTGGDAGCVDVGKKLLRGNSVARGENRLGVGGSSNIEGEKGREKLNVC